ncbi:winged helix-turn-helix transcriptional regulator [Stenotrophomonas rhizophila]|uniref:winged helix-turn-helix transcriptional regulator n=1 Tax=Stenotrophomonas rhizophila TaxID=216778 RepID=UPI000EAEEEEA|nr:winged helix-turn-helix transcriptional regulator [Stenotrophomonas rhizophila]
MWAINLSRLAGIDAAVRFSDLQRAMAPITQKELTSQLRLFEKWGLIRRTVYAEVPPPSRATLAGYVEFPGRLYAKAWEAVVTRVIRPRSCMNRTEGSATLPMGILSSTEGGCRLIGSGCRNMCDAD